jgi:hypothetical protein
MKPKMHLRYQKSKGYNRGIGGKFREFVDHPECSGFVRNFITISNAVVVP